MDQKKNDQEIRPCADLLDLDVFIYDKKPDKKLHSLFLLLWKADIYEFDKKFYRHLLVNHDDLRMIVAKLQKYLEDSK